MRKLNLRARIDRLKAAPAMRDMPAIFGLEYDYLWEMDKCFPWAPTDTEESRRVRFEKRLGTREEFIERKKRAWSRRNGRGENA